ncbi:MULTISPECIES: TRAP transporter substrate-binding protein [Modicisalibacter]|uniref:TRAP transporter substrate-binding protein n=1 Tax=Modicisalibacter TaxID=574347 RepID=UPI00100A7822|nr:MULTISPECIES: TRAP transporter substrate-binding protein [Halomonadaceae]MBZ9558561.1 TRAP transporter substrate-binding protein [Modicisalibacter sp. R2A 31.J]MBZ9575547.1 TRAP transporter substrate-binding protein [Modicisalibacter sp. MOD 31.J]
MTKKTVVPGIACLAGAIGLAGVLASPLAAAGDITLSYAFISPTSTFPGVQMEHWAEEIERRTDGRVTVNTFPGGTLLTADNMYDGVRSGVADIGLSITSYEPNRFPLLNLAGSLTGLQVDSSVASQTVYELIQEFPPEQLGLEDFKVITAFTAEPGYLQTKDPVTSLEALQGQEIRVPGDATDVLAALGGVPIALAQSDTGEALQAGVVDGYVSSREVLMDLRYARTVKYVTDYPLTNAVLVAVMNRQRWESLPKDVQAVIDDLGPEMARYAGDYLDGHVAESLAWARKEEGVEVLPLSEAEAARWDERLAPVNQQRLTRVAEMGLPAEAFETRMLELFDHYRQSDGVRD